MRRHIRTKTGLEATKPALSRCSRSDSTYRCTCSGEEPRTHTDLHMRPFASRSDCSSSRWLSRCSSGSDAMSVRLQTATACGRCSIVTPFRASHARTRSSSSSVKKSSSRSDSLEIATQRSMQVVHLRPRRTRKSMSDSPLLPLPSHARACFCVFTCTRRRSTEVSETL